MTERKRRRGTVAIMTLAPVTILGAVIGVSIEPAAAEPRTISNAVLEWGFNPEVQGPSLSGGCHFFSAGESDGLEPTYKSQEGSVGILKGGSLPTWASKCAGTGSLDQKILWTGGTGTADAATGAVSITFPGKASLNFYGGSAPITFINPVLTVNTSGGGSLTATMDGYMTEMGTGQKDPIHPPINNVRVANLTGVSSNNLTGFTATPTYSGVCFDLPAGSFEAPQNRTTSGWGAWPVSPASDGANPPCPVAAAGTMGFVDFNFISGMTSYFYTSGTSLDAKKPPSPITITFANPDVPAGFNGKIDRVRAAGSDTTYFLMQALTNLYNSSPGCDLSQTDYSQCAPVQPGGSLAALSNEVAIATPEENDQVASAEFANHDRDAKPNPGQALAVTAVLLGATVLTLSLLARRRPHRS